MSAETNTRRSPVEGHDCHVFAWRRWHAQDSHVWACWRHESDRRQIRFLLRILREVRARAALTQPGSGFTLKGELRRYVRVSAQLWLAMIWVGRRRRRLLADGWRDAAKAASGILIDLREERTFSHRVIKSLRSRLEEAS